MNFTAENMQLGMSVILAGQGRRRTNSIRLVLSVVFLGLINLGIGSPAARKVKDGNALFKQEKYGEALAKYNEAQQELPDSPEIYFNIGDVQYRKGDYEKAGSLFRKAAAEKEQSLRSQAFYNQGNTHYRAGKLREALAAYKKAIELNPKDRDAKFNYEFVSLKLQEQQKKQQQQEQQKGEGKKEEQKEQKEKQEEKNAQPRPSPSPSSQPQPAPSSQPQEMNQEQAERLLNALQSEEEEQRVEQPALEFPEVPEASRDW